jgi:predicted phosphodiesterase
MRSVAALYDIHGNLPALDAVLTELREEPPDAIVIGGDVAAGPLPVEVLGRLRALSWPVHYLRGNADRFVVMGYDGTIPERLLEHPLYRADAWTATLLERADRDWLDALPPAVRLPVDGFGEVLFCHATPDSDEERVSIFSTDERLAGILGRDGAPVVVAGHTHRQFERTIGNRRWINAGSVGRPYEHGPGAYWLRLGPGVDLRRTPYDVDAAVAAFRAAGYPLADTVLAPVDPDEIARRYEEQAV